MRTCASAVVDLFLSKQVAWTGWLFYNESVTLQDTSGQCLDIVLIYNCVPAHNSY